MSIVRMCLVVGLVAVFAGFGIPYVSAAPIRPTAQIVPTSTIEMVAYYHRHARRHYRRAVRRTYYYHGHAYYHRRYYYGRYHYW